MGGADDVINRKMHGCCVDKACTELTCMELPEGKSCGDCVHERRCCLMFGHVPTDTYCDWFPRRFCEVAKVGAGATANPIQSGADRTTSGAIGQP